MVHMPQLTEARRKTRAIGGNQVHYRFTLTIHRRTHEFDCYLDTQDKNWTLLVGHINEAWSNIYPVYWDKTAGGLAINPYLDHAKYLELRRILGIQSGTGNKWPVTTILEQADAAASNATIREWVDPRLLANRNRSDVEEADKTVFDGFAHWGATGRHVRASNLDKTRRFLGPEIADRCRTNNISSRWRAPRSGEPINEHRPQLP